MIEIEDLCNVALTIDKALKEISSNKKEITNPMVTLEVPKLTLMDIDKKLYMMTNDTDACYVPGDKVECTMLGIRFCILPKAE